MTSHWSWFFIFSLLVLPRYAHGRNNDDDIIALSNITQYVGRSLSLKPDSPSNDAAIALIALAGVLLFVTLVVFLYFQKRRHVMNDVEEGDSDVAEEKPQWWHIDLESAKGTSWWVLETKGGGKERKKKNSGDVDYPIKSKTSHLDRLRNLFARKDSNNTTNKSEISFHPAFPQAEPSETDHIARPLPVVPNSQPRYPSVLDRPGNPPDFPPPSPFKNANLARTILAVETRERMDRRRVQPPPKAPMAPHGRIVPRLPDHKIKSPKYKRRSWLARRSFINPFLPLKESDAFLPTSISAGLAMRQQLANSPQSQSRAITRRPSTSPPNASDMENATKKAQSRFYEDPRRIPSPTVRVPSTGGVPGSLKHKTEERGLRSASPYGYQSRSAATHRVV